jgi:hypothetical protein
VTAARAASPLSPAEAERLAVLAEDLGNASATVGAILRHGYEAGQPGGGASNRDGLAGNLGELIAAAALLASASDLDVKTIYGGVPERLARKRAASRHQEPRL